MIFISPVASYRIDYLCAIKVHTDTSAVLRNTCLYRQYTVLTRNVGCESVGVEGIPLTGFESCNSKTVTWMNYGQKL